MFRIFNLSLAHPLLTELMGAAQAGQPAPLVIAEEHGDVLPALEFAAGQMVLTGTHPQEIISLFMDPPTLETLLTQLRERNQPLDLEIPPPPPAPDLDRILPKRLSRPLLEKTTGWRETLEYLPAQAVIFQISDSGVHLLAANREATRVAGMTEEEMKAIPFHLLVHPDDLGRMMMFIKETVEQRQGVMEQVQLKTRRDGQEVYVYSDVLVLMPEEGNEGIALVIDQTQLQRTLLAYERSSAELVRYREYLLNGPPCSIHELDGKGRLQVTLKSKSMAALLGYSLEELDRLKIKDLLTTSSYPQFADMLNRFQGLQEQGDTVSGRRIEYMIVMRHRNGTEFPVDFVATVGTIDGETFVRADYADARPRLQRLALEQEHDRLRREQEQLKANERAAAVVAHDVDNGLTGVRSWNTRAEWYMEKARQALAAETEAQRGAILAAIIVELVAKGYVAEETKDGAKSVLEMLSVIMNACSHFHHQADNMAELTSRKLRQSINYQEGAISLGTFRINSIVEKEAIEKRLRHANIETKFHLEPSAGYVTADPKLLEEVIQILVDNAVDAMVTSANRVLTISTATQSYDEAGLVELKRHVTLINESHFEAGDKVVLSVQDTGEGIPADNLRTIFEPGVGTRDHQPTSVLHETGRSGMGLFRALSLMTSFTGAIGVTSSVGRGSTFLLYLPLAEPTRDSFAGIRLG